MHEASALVAGATLAAARAVWRGETGHAANIAGGLHHAMRLSASGFCVYNDPAIAIRWLLEQGAQRIDCRVGARPRKRPIVRDIEHRLLGICAEEDLGRHLMASKKPLERRQIACAIGLRQVLPVHTNTM